ncbi:MAG: DUF2442 domain-containing protein [Verrucomicrobiae bacterium]|nr:DUF2442 domain-containing protein [Verrucomicrobiae bacterium]
MKIESNRCVEVEIQGEAFLLKLNDGRKVIVPYECYPLLARATSEQRQKVEIYAQGRMLHWPLIDEDIEVEHILEGKMPVKLQVVAHS